MKIFLDTLFVLDRSINPEIFELNKNSSITFINHLIYDLVNILRSGNEDCWEIYLTDRSIKHINLYLKFIFMMYQKSDNEEFKKSLLTIKNETIDILNRFFKKTKKRTFTDQEIHVEVKNQKMKEYFLITESKELLGNPKINTFSLNEGYKEIADFKSHIECLIDSNLFDDEFIYQWNKREWDGVINLNYWSTSPMDYRNEIDADPPELIKKSDQAPVYDLSDDSNEL